MNLVDVIIPTYKPDNRFLTSIKRLLAQSVKPGKIIIINTDKSIWDKSGIEENIRELFYGSEVNLYIEHILKSDFDHGAARNLGVSKSDAKYFICMTQDAVCFDKETVKYLLRGMDNSIKLAYARQVPDKRANKIEKFTREFNYPIESMIKSFNERQTLGIKTYFASNVCAAYERETFDVLGGFDTGEILNEDMLFAYKLIEHGYFIKYEAWAKVIHSHNYSGAEQFKRNFDIGVSQASNPKIFKNIKSESEGKKLVLKTFKYLLATHSYISIIRLIYISGCKYTGFFMGRNFKKLPKGMVRALSMNKGFWR